MSEERRTSSKEAGPSNPVSFVSKQLDSLKRGLLSDQKIQTAFSGALAGIITSVFVCPLDVLKTRMQIQRRIDIKYNGLLSGLQRIVREEGLKGLYRGITPTLIALLPNWAVYFTAYERLKADLGRTFSAHSHSPLLHMASACGAGVLTVAVTNPLWVIKTRLQTQSMRLNMGRLSGPPYRGTWHAITRIAQEEGLPGLYSGLLPSMLGVSHVVIQFPLYEQAKLAMARHRKTTVNELGLMDILAASALSKAVASTITYPHEVVRSHMHIMGAGPLTGFVPTCKQIWLEEGGVRGFYKGCGMNLLRTIPAAAITFTSFELILRSIKHCAEQEAAKNTVDL